MSRNLAVILLLSAVAVLTTVSAGMFTADDRLSGTGDIIGVTDGIGDTNVSPIMTPMPSVQNGANTVSPISSPKYSVSPSVSLIPDIQLKLDETPEVSIPSVTPPVVTVSPSSPVSVHPAVSMTPTVSPSPAKTPVPVSSHTPSPTSTPTPSIAPTPALLFSVVINEVAWAGTKGSTADEWIELRNCSDNAVDLTGWVLRSRTGADPDPVIILSGAVSSGGYYLLERTDSSTTSIGEDQTYSGALSNSPAGELLELADQSGSVIDFVDGTASWMNAGDNATKATMERVDCSSDADSNWATNNGIVINGQDVGGNPIQGTPKSKNSISP